MLKNKAKQFLFILLKHRKWKIHMLKCNSCPEERQNCRESNTSYREAHLVGK